MDQSTLAQKAPKRRKGSNTKVVSRASSRDHKRSGLPIKLVLMTVGVQFTGLLIAFFIYTGLHSIKISFQPPTLISLELPEFGFIHDNRSIGSIVEVLFWSAVATTLRWIRIGIVSSRQRDFNPGRHLLEWTTDLVTSSIVAAVIVYALRSTQFSVGESVKLSIQSADAEVFVVLGFLLGFVAHAPQNIVRSIWKRTFGASKAAFHSSNEIKK